MSRTKVLYSVMIKERWVIYGVLCLILVVAAFQYDRSADHARSGKTKRYQCLACPWWQQAFYSTDIFK